MTANTGARQQFKLVQRTREGASVTIQELEQIEDRARRGLPIDSEVVLILTAYLRDVLQEKMNAEAVACEALRRAGLNARYYTAEMRRAS